jgi:hypothetical protein
MTGRGIIFLALVLTAVGAYGQSEYPSWFLEPPSEKCYSVFAESDEEALERASFILVAYDSSEVRGNFQQLRDTARMEGTLWNTDYHYYYDQARAEKLSKSLTVLARYKPTAFDHQWLFLVGPSGTKFTGDCVKCASDVIPDWVRSGLPDPSASGLTTSIGTFSYEGSSAYAWVKAEEIALFNLMAAQTVNVGQWTEDETSSDRSTMEQVEWFRMDYRIKNLRVLGRWADLEKNVVYVEVGLPVGSIEWIGKKNKE